jgi:MFS family permease
LAGIGIFASYSIVQQPLAYWLKDSFGLSSSQAASWLGLAMTAFAVAGTVIQLFVIPNLKFQPRQYLIPGFMLIGTGSLVILGLQSFAGLIVGMGAMGVGLSIAFVGYAGELSSRVNDDERGQAGGVIGATPAVGFMIGPLAGALAYEVDGQLPFIVTACLWMGWFWPIRINHMKKLPPLPPLLLRILNPLLIPNRLSRHQSHRLNLLSLCHLRRL